MSIKSKSDRYIGGFAGLNSGEIRESYSKTVFPKTVVASGFCMKNEGTIDKCLSCGLVKKKQINSFCKENIGSIERSFIDIKDPKADLGELDEIRRCDFENTDTNEMGIEIEASWIQPGSLHPFVDVQFDRNKVNIMDDFADKEIQPVKISTVEELFQACKDVNRGIYESSPKSYILENDINLKGKKWTPMGNEIFPFTGQFEGKGHKIYNFVVKDRKLTFSGFFGCAENALISNLCVDGVIKTGVCTGTFLGINKNSKIENCGASSYIIASQCTGGFVGKNEGIIEKCFYSGKIRKRFFTWIFGLIPIIIATVLFCLYFFNPYGDKSIFNDVPIDPYAVKMEEMNFTGDQNKASFSISDAIEFFGGEGTSTLQNPGNSNQSMRISIHITDEELLGKLGYTGRTKKEQTKLESGGSYNPSNSRVTVCQSGLIPPGYQLPKLILRKLPDGTNLPVGAYKATIVFSFYNYVTNEKAIIDSQVPVLVIIR